MATTRPTTYAEYLLDGLHLLCYAKGSSVERDAGDAKPLRAHAHYIKGTKSSALVYNIDSVATRDCALPWDACLSLLSC